MEEDIKNLQEIINLCEEEIRNNDENITATLDLQDLKSLAKLLKENENLKQALIINKNLYEKVCNKNKELAEEIDKIKKTYINPAKMRISYYDAGKGMEVGVEGFIPKSLIKEKIDELEEEKKCFYSDYAIEERNNKIQVLQELLREEK